MNFFNFKYKTFAIAFVFLFSAQFVFGAEVKIRQLGGSWKMTVDGEDYFVKGVEYSADKVNSFPDINEWMWSDINENGKIDGPYDSWVDSDRDNFQSADENAVGDFALLKAMGANTIRIYHSENVNKELLRDLYNSYGIMVIMGNYLGAYTIGSDATWNEGTDYTDSLQRSKMKESVMKMVLEHKDEPYLLMWMLGNENDSGGHAVNSTKTNTNAVTHPKEYAEFLNEVAAEIKKIDENHPVGVCNATVKFLDYYAKYSPDIDVLGFNQYSGPFGFGVLWNRVKTECSKPVLITEYGCDSYNSNKKGEDERYQAQYHSAAWKDIENNGFYGGGAGNSIGGVVYCWLDKWWLIGSHKAHDTELGAWKGPKIDNFFHDEWLGVCSQGDGKQSPFKRQLKEVYFMYQEDFWPTEKTENPDPDA